jgi:hypothetical protein
MRPRPDEIQFRAAILAIYEAGGHPYAGALAQALGIPGKRARYLCEKWEDKGWWESGVSPLAGWLTEAGLLRWRADKPVWQQMLERNEGHELRTPFGTFRFIGPAPPPFPPREGDSGAGR